MYYYMVKSLHKLRGDTLQNPIKLRLRILPDTGAQLLSSQS